MFRYILFDLDGTLSDPKEGICKSVQYALDKMGIKEPDLDKLEPFIGPPLADSFREFYGMDKTRAQQAVDFYRERFSALGLYENKIYPGITELLDELKDKGAFLAIASSKPTVFVEKILKFFKISDYFDVVVGSELNGQRGTKEEVLAEALSKLKALDEHCVHTEDNFGVHEDGTPLENFIYRANLDITNTAMVGDRKFDVEAAGKAGIYAVGVEYGYAAKGELKSAGAMDIARDVRKLKQILISGDGVDHLKIGTDHFKKSQKNIENCEASIANNEKKPEKIADREKKEVLASPLDTLVYKTEIPAVSFMRAVYMIAPLFMFWAIRYGLYYLIFYFIYKPQVLDKVANGSITDWYEVINCQKDYDAVITLIISLVTGIILILLYKKKDPVSFHGNLQPKSIVMIVLMGTVLAKGLNLLIAFVCSKVPALVKIYETAGYAGGVNFGLGLLTYVLVTPILEEITFRWLFYGRTRRILGKGLGIFCSSLVFGIYHMNLIQGIYAFLMGLALAIVYELTGSIISSVALHVSANAIIFVQAYLGENAQNAMNSVIAMVISLLASAILIYTFVLSMKQRKK